MADYFFHQESLFRMGRRERIDIESPLVSEAYVIREVEESESPAMIALENYQLEFNFEGDRSYME